MHAPSYAEWTLRRGHKTRRLLLWRTRLGGRTITGMCSRCMMDVRQPGVIRCRSWLSGRWGFGTR